MVRHHSHKPKAVTIIPSIAKRVARIIPPQSMSSTYKPSPLSFGSPRSSPFRRPESPASPSNMIRATTPTTSPTKAHTPIQSPSKLHSSNTPTSNEGTWTPRALTPSITQREPPASPTRGANAPNGGSMMIVRGGNGDALAKLQPAQVREMREGFQILDRDSDGQVTRDDVLDMLTNLGIHNCNFFTSRG